MDERDELAARFAPHRGHLRAVAVRMLGSAAEADDAVQETWLRFSRADVSEVENLRGWLVTVVSRVCLNMLRARRRDRGEAPVSELAEYLADGAAGVEPEAETVLIDSVGRALLVVLDRLGPAERLAFVLHDLFAVPFDDIAPIVERTPATTKKLASRARRRVRGDGTMVTPPADLPRQREVVDAFLAASRHGDIDALLAVLDPEVVRRADPVVLPAGAAPELHGARALAEETVANTRRARVADLALVNGVVGIVVAPRGSLVAVVRLGLTGDRVREVEIITEPSRLAGLDLTPLD